MTTDPLGRAAHRAIDAYCWADVPTSPLEHALLTAVMELVNKRSGMPVTMRVGDVQIRRGGK